MDNFQLSNFSSVFELCVGFSFLYAAFENFSKNISYFFSLPIKKYAKSFLNESSQKIQLLIDKKNQLNNQNLETDKLIENINKPYIQINRIYKKLLPDEGDNENGGVKYDLEFSLKFKSIYLICGFYSLTILIFSASIPYLNEQKLYSSFFLTDFIVLILSIYVFVSTFTYSLPRINPLISILVFLTMCFLFYCDYKDSFLWYSKIELSLIPKKNCTIFFTVFVVILPFVLHFTRVSFVFLKILFYYLMLEAYFKMKHSQIKKELIKIEDAKALIDQYTRPN